MTHTQYEVIAEWPGDNSMDTSDRFSPGDYVDGRCITRQEAKIMAIEWARERTKEGFKCWIGSWLIGSFSNNLQGHIKF